MRSLSVVEMTNNGELKIGQESYDRFNFSNIVKKKKTATVPSTAEQEKGLRGSQLYYKQILW
jgi:hypothetical protein